MAVGPEVETDSELQIDVNTGNERFPSTKRRLRRPNQIVFGSGSLMREPRSFRRSFSPKRSRHYRPSIRISGLFENSPSRDLSSLLEV